MEEVHHEFLCGCTASFDCVEFDGAERACFEFSIHYCEEHWSVEVFVGSDWLRFDLKALPEEVEEHG